MDWGGGYMEGCEFSRCADGDQHFLLRRCQLPNRPREPAVFANAPEVNDGEQNNYRWQNSYMEYVKAQQSRFADAMATQQNLAHLAADRSEEHTSELQS